MLSCEEAFRLMARRAEPDGVLDDSDRARLESHLAACVSCRAALDDQRVVSEVLRSRPLDRVSPDFAARLSTRLDETRDWLGIADWRAWTVRLAPVAAALGLVVYLTSASPSAGEIDLAQWTEQPAAAGDASMLWQDDVPVESVIESMLDAGSRSGGGSGDVR